MTHHQHRWQINQALPPIVLYKLADTNPFFRNQKYWLAGGGATPDPIIDTMAFETNTPSESIMSGELSPDGELVAWLFTEVGSDTELRVTEADDSGTPDILTTGVRMSHLHWHPEGDRILYTRANNTSDNFGEIHEITLGGTDTLLYNRTGGFPHHLSIFNIQMPGPLYNHDASLIAWSDTYDAFMSPWTYEAHGIWVWDRGSSTATRIVAGRNGEWFGLFFPWSLDLVESIDLIGWAPDSDVLYFFSRYVTSGDPPYSQRLEKVNADGSGRTVLRDIIIGPSGETIGNSFIPSQSTAITTPEGEFLIGKYKAYASDPMWQVALMSTTTGAITPISPERLMYNVSNASWYGPQRYGDRIYWVQGEEEQLVSVALDGSDFMVDHDWVPTDEDFRHLGGYSVS